MLGQVLQCALQPIVLGSIHHLASPMMANRHHLLASIRQVHRQLSKGGCRIYFPRPFARVAQQWAPRTLTVIETPPTIETWTPSIRILRIVDHI